MRTHLQGFLLLGLLLAALWGATRLASPAFDDAFGEDGAVAADSGEDLVELTIADSSLDAPLTSDELQRLQFQLLRAGFLDNPSEVDGLAGDITTAAIAAAAAEWGLVDPSDRAVLAYADERLSDVPFLAGQ